MASNITALPDAAAPADVLVVGAGPGGSALAAQLARQGFAVTAVDRAGFPRDKACSEYMSPEAVRLLDRLGVLSELEAGAAAPLGGTRVVGAHGSRLHGRFAGGIIAPFRPTGLSVARTRLDAALVHAARSTGATVLERTTVEELLFDRGAVAGAVVREADGQRRALRARLTVGADGLRSLVARRLGPRRHGRPRRLAFVAHVDGVEGMGDAAELHVGRRGYVGLNPIGGGRTNVALVVPADRGADARGRAEAFWLETLRDFPEVHTRVAGGALARRVMVTGPFAAWSGRVTADGAALVGDAADFFDPFTGEGIYCGLRGGELLATHALAALGAETESASDSALARYHRARRTEFAGKWIVERLIGAAVGWARAMNYFSRTLAARKDMADLLVGVTGNFVPAREVLRPTYLLNLFRSSNGTPAPGA
jgi:menaquinone-9 beta-reductase